MQSNNNGAVVFLGTVGFICLAVWWIEDRFGASMTGMVLVGLGVAGAICLGFVLNMASSKNILSNLTEFNKQDAQVDRYRQQSFTAMARGEAAERSADAKVRVIEARRVDQLANHRAKLITDVERQKWELEQQNQQARQPVDAEPDDWWQTNQDDDQDGWR